MRSALRWLPAGCRWVLVKEGEEPPSAPSRQNADRDAQAARRAGSHTTPLDKAMGPSGEGARLQELVTLSGLAPTIALSHGFRQNGLPVRPFCSGEVSASVPVSNT